jgi:hypothetical protein
MTSTTLHVAVESKPKFKIFSLLTASPTLDQEYDCPLCAKITSTQGRLYAGSTV